MTTLTLSKTAVSPIRLVVDNRNVSVFELRDGVSYFPSRLGRMREFLAGHTVISNGPHLNKIERAALALADFVEAGYKRFISDNLGETEARVYPANKSSEEIRKGAIEILKGRNFNVTYSEVVTGNSRFTLSRRKAK